MGVFWGSSPKCFFKSPESFGFVNSFVNAYYTEIFKTVQCRVLAGSIKRYHQLRFLSLSPLRQAASNVGLCPECL